MNVDRLFVEDDVIKGFIRVNESRGMANLQYLFLAKPYRNIVNARKLINMFEDVSRGMGYKKGIVHADDINKYKMLKYYFRKEPCAYRNKTAVFVVDIKGD